MSFREANMNAGVIEQLREIVGRAFQDMQEIVGGFDLLPQAFFRRLKDRLRFGAAVNAIEQDEHGVTVHYRSPAGRFSVRGDHCIVAIPFSVLRDVEVTPSFGRPKQKAIRELNYNASTKILLQTRTRFWERTDGIVGGTTVTDLPIRRICYPSFSDPEEERVEELVASPPAPPAALGRVRELHGASADYLRELELRFRRVSALRSASKRRSALRVAPVTITTSPSARSSGATTVPRWRVSASIWAITAIAVNRKRSVLRRRPTTGWAKRSSS
jgi:hypothetical protein